MYQTLLTSLENNVLIITINRPEKLNALNKEVFTDLNNVITEIEKNDQFGILEQLKGSVFGILFSSIFGLILAAIFKSKPSYQQ